MADIKQYTDQIKNAVYGEEVRDSIINALNKVNDDNNSYQNIKDEIKKDKRNIEDTVDEFGGLVEQVTEAKEMIASSLAAIDTAKSELALAVTDANTKKDEVVAATKSANSTRTTLQSVIDSANTAKTNAETAKTNLDGSISSAKSLKADLDSSITNAGQANQNLIQQQSNAATSGKNLDAAISSASTAKTGLQSVIENANTVKSDLSDVLTKATDTSTALTKTMQSATQLDSHISNENDRAENNINALDVRLGNADEILTGVEDLKAYLGYNDEHIVGLQVDFKNNVFNRLAGAYGLNAGTGFDAFPMYGGRRRCNVSSAGTINAYYGENGYVEDGSNGQVMVYQPVFWYKVVPIELEKNTVSGIGYHIRKANYYISGQPKNGFKRHPLFYDAQGNPVDYVLLSAFEGSMYDVSEAQYIDDSTDTSVVYGTGDLLCSVADKRPISGKCSGIGTKANLETMANNHGNGWHLETIKATSANQLLMMIEMGTLSLQEAIGNGIVSIKNSVPNNHSFLTASNNAITYRGMENPWGNISKHINGINLWGNGKMGGGQVYIADDFYFDENKHDDNYKPTEFTISNDSGYVSAFGYGSEEFDWLFLPSETLGNSSLPVGDYCLVSTNLNTHKIVRFGGNWSSGDYAGGFYWHCNNYPAYRNYDIGGRLLYVPTSTEIVRKDV